MKIAIDPGHGRDPGAVGGGMIEADWALGFAKRLGHYIRVRGGQTVFTRESDVRVGLATRGKIAKQQKCNVFLSIHLNGVEDVRAHGCEAFTAPNDERSALLAMRLLGEVTKVMGFKSRGVKPDNKSQHKSLAVLRSTYKAMPAVLLEVGFLSNAGDAAKLRDSRLIENLAIALAKELLK